MDANYRKNNDRSLNSSTYHKKDGTNMRAILKEEAAEEIEEARTGMSWQEYLAMREKQPMMDHRNPQGESTYKVCVLTIADVAKIMEDKT